MRFLSVADRELRSAARQRTTYRTRWVTGALFFGLLVWLLWVLDGFTSKRNAVELFNIFSVLSFIYCAFLSAGRTADCISAERREGTLGLLFLTNLNSAEIISGKFCSTALAAVYGLMAIFPMLGLPLLLGGITFGHFGRAVLALLLGIISALAAGFLSSVLCKRHFTAVALALGLTVLQSGGLMLAAAAADSYVPTRPLAPFLAVFTPVYTLIAADGTRALGSNHYWLSAGAVAAAAGAVIGLTILLLARTWRDRPQRLGLWQRLRFGRRSERAPSKSRTALRRRLLGINPLFWLASRQRVSAPVFMLLAIALVLLTVYVTIPFFGRVMMGRPAFMPVLTQLFAWLWTGLAIHVLVMYYAAAVASQRLAEDRQTGALELLLSTPTTERTISRGLWLAFGRKMLFPALLAVLVHCFFIWTVLVMMTVDPPGRLPSNVAPGELLWSILFDQPLRTHMLDWQFAFILRIPLLLLPLLMMTWPTLGWVGRWQGLRMKHPGFAPLASLVLLLAPPVLLFTLFCFVADKLELNRLPPREFLPMLLWTAFAIGCGHCLTLSVWAATRLHQQLRAVALSRYQPPPAWQWRLPSRHAVRRFALATAGVAAAVVLLVGSYYGYQNWRSHRAWRIFQRTLKQSGESLSLAAVLPAPAPAEANLARSPAFLAWLNPTNRESKNHLERLCSLETPSSGPNTSGILMNWSHQNRVPLRSFVQSPRSKTNSNLRKEEAAAILEELAPLSGQLRELAAKATRCPAFQTATNRDASAVLHAGQGEVLLLERLHLLFEVRACAELAVGQQAEAADDVLAGLHLAELARQFPDTRATMRVQRMLVGSLQPLWEGLSQHAWTESQLSSLQQALTRFDLLVDYTNAVRRAVLAHIEIWQAIPGSTNPVPGLPVADGAYRRDPALQFQPRAAWFESCMELYEAGRVALEQVDLGTGRVSPAMNWIDLSGLPTDSSTRELLQQSSWWGANPSSLAFVQTSVNQAVIACALERYRLAQGAYPESLASLAPQLLACVPHDAVSGRPIIYQFVGKNTFILRGVGPNGMDDRKNPSSDDWLWSYSTNKPVKPNKPSPKKK